MKIVGISTGPDTHLDHLGVLCSLLEIPLIVTDPDIFKLAQTFYPQCQTHLFEPAALSLDFLQTHFDVLLECGKFWALELVPTIELLYGKKMRIVFCPHGNSDKGRLLAADLHAPQDVALYYGSHMRELLENTGAWTKFGHAVRTSNYRIDFYRQHKSFYDGLMEKELSNLDLAKKTVLYAPTWADGESPTSFFIACEQVIDQLGDKFNLIVKLHPLLEEFHPGPTYRILARYEQSRSVHFLNRFPPIYPLLARTDLYLGDYSSIGYDYLAFDRPMLFFHAKNQASPLQACGESIDNLTHILRDVQTALEHKQTHLSEQRRQVYQYAFGDPMEAKEIKEKIEQALV